MRKTTKQKYDLKKFVVSKSNSLNLFWNANEAPMTLTELRFFYLYLSKLNPKDPEKREVLIPVSEYEQMFGVQFNSSRFMQDIRKVIERSMYIHDGNDKNRLILLYSYVDWYDDDKTIFKVACNKDIEQHIFSLRKEYTSYELSSIYKLNTTSSIRLYEILNQFAFIGKAEFTFENLKNYLGCTYPTFKEFKRSLLIPAMTQINKFTDLKILEVQKKGRPIHSVIFYIEKIERDGVIDVDVSEISTQSEAKTLPNDTAILTDSEIVEMKSSIVQKIRSMHVYLHISYSEDKIQYDSEILWEDSYSALRQKCSISKVKSPTAYMLGIIGNKLKVYQERLQGAC